MLIDELKNRYAQIRNSADKAALACGRNPEDIEVIAVSKTQPAETLAAAMKAGIGVFGENYAQEFRDKREELFNLMGTDPIWNFIGKLQTNKVKYLAPYVHSIHTVDNLKLAEEIDKHAEKNSRIIEICLQVNTSGEESKSGCEPEELITLAESVIGFKNIKVAGLMTIGTFSENERIIRKEFTLLRELRDAAVAKLGIELKKLSMGMSHDFEIAIQEGATSVRVGTAIFGYRDYSK